ncbi:MAG: alpha/beta hydrolase-fold protein [Steroidobacteraceae bacterium]
MSFGRRTVLAALLAMSMPTVLAATMPEPSPVTGPGVTGTVVRYAGMPSMHVAKRNVDVWLPPSYGKDPAQRYPVLYMHDGQNLFDPATSYGGVDWAVDEVMTSLIEKGGVREAIVVGVWNTPKRRDEYMPQRPVRGKIKFNVPGAEDLDAADIVSDRYLEFLVKELKPFIDATYRTLPGRADTLVMGSSMGGLVSQYAMSQYPDVFGGAGCISTHWPAGNGIALDDFAAHLPDPATHKYWFDYGTATLDALYEPYQKRADEILRKAGYVEGRNWITRKFEGAEHSEKAWRLRVDQPLVFLLGR